MTPEFDLIARHFTRPARQASLGVGDDCALFSWSEDRETAISTDTLVAGVHFFSDVNPEHLGHKALAVNLSDLAAMGAAPRYVTLALTLPEVNHEWLKAFARGLFQLADHYGVELIGGDTTRGPLSMTLTVIGAVDGKTALRRDRAKEGDEIWVSGRLGGAALALAHLQGDIKLAPAAFAEALPRLHRPEPRIGLGMGLLGHAHAAIDVSDGLVADLGHICERSHLAATLDWPALPLAPALADQPESLRLRCALAGGDDYELCFTAPEGERGRIAALDTEMGLALHRIGRMYARQEGGALVTVLDAEGRALALPKAGYDHFSAKP